MCWSDSQFDLTNLTPSVLEKEKEKPVFKREVSRQDNVGGEIYRPDIFSGTVALHSPLSGDLQDLLQETDPMMDRTERRMPNGKPMYNCKLCGKESEKGAIRRHIETYHIEGIAIPCKSCGKTFRSRNLLSQHNRKYHKY